MDVAEKGGYLRKPKVGWYEPVDPSTGEVLSEKLMRAKEIVDNKEFWVMMFEKTNFTDYIKNAYTVGGNIILSDNEAESQTIEVDPND
jgi:hypothetical protein